MDLGSGTVREGVELVLERRPYVTVSGSVVGLHNLDTVPVLKLIPSENGKVSTDLDTLTTSPGTDGHFSFGGVPPGSYLIRTTVFPAAGGRALQLRHGYVFEGTIPTVPSGSTWHGEVAVTVGKDHVSNLVVTLNAGYRISGEIIVDTHQGYRKPRATALSIVSVDGVQLGTLPLTGVDEQGRFRTVEVPPGNYTLLVHRPPALIQSVSVDGEVVPDSVIDIGAQTVDRVVVTMTDRFGTITGSVFDNIWRLREDASIYVFPTDRRLWIKPSIAFGRFANTTSVRSATYSASGLLPGEYFIAARSGGASAQWTSLESLESFSRVAVRTTLAADESKVIDIRLK
jgi:hypothetical protein